MSIFNNRCSCPGHRFPGVHHVRACCDRPHVKGDGPVVGIAPLHKCYYASCRECGPYCTSCGSKPPEDLPLTFTVSLYEHVEHIERLRRGTP